MADLLDILLNGDYALQVNGISKHLNTPVKYNETNSGFGLEAKYGNSLATIGGYKNSLNSPSYYAGLGWEKQWGTDPYMSLGVLGGIVTGYDDPITPMVLPKMSFGLSDIGKLNFMYAPKYKQSPATLMMNLSVPF